MTTETATIQSNPYTVGLFCRAIDAHLTKLTPGCVSNVSAMPDKWPVFLRHVLRSARRHEQTAPLLAQLETGEWSPGGSFWLGYHGGR